MDAYQTPYEAVLPLLPHIGVELEDHPAYGELSRCSGIKTFAEPCSGDGQLVTHLEGFGLECVYEGDLARGQDALFLNGQDLAEVDYIITNPPWTRQLLHPLIERFMHLKPTWMLFDADWCHTKQAAFYLPSCSHIVSVGRVKWIPDSPSTGKDNAAWYRFTIEHETGPRFYGRNWAHEVVA
jgi:hypothetical protein